jgi:maltose alpha-D-glucosyltransferase / alpha-amylase
MEERWYKNGLIYALSVRTFADSNADGIGDFPGLASRLDYLSSLGVTCIWLLPFYPSPWRDEGYDVSDYYGVDPSLGTLGDFVEFVQRAAARGMRVIVDLVLNHTSDKHPWFQAARAGEQKFRDYYVWADRRPADAESGITFPGVQKTTWSYDRKARRYYFHRFYDFQPDLNIDNPAVRQEMRKIIAFWVELGIAGFRLDAAPFVIEPAGARGLHPGPEFAYLHDFRNQLSWQRGDAILLGEANVERDQAEDYFGIGGMHMLFNFTANQQLWLALAREDGRPLVRALKQTAGIPASDQWANFLRNHDEIDLGRLAEDERADVFESFGREPEMQLYGRGIRRRLAPMLECNRARIELAFSLLLTLPGTPVLYYGDEIGMGEDLSLPERRSIRTPMQWTPDRNGGFSTAPKRDFVAPIVSTGPLRYASVNVADADRDPDSLLNWLRRALRVRRQRPAFGEAGWDAVETGDSAVIALRYQTSFGDTLAVHNLSSEARRTKLRVNRAKRSFVDVFANRAYDEWQESVIELDAYGYRWIAATSQ